MPNYPILPSLSRAPSFESTRKIEDGTLKDPMESGYVATRPRFTRLRRTFGVSYKFLSALDVQILDQFEVSTVQGGAGAFYMPNLLANGNFNVSDGWTFTEDSIWEPKIPVPAPNNIGQMYFWLPPDSPLIYPGQTVGAIIRQSAKVMVAAGDQMVFSGITNVVDFGPSFFVLGTYPQFDFDSGSQVAAPQTLRSSGNVPVYFPFTVPAGATEMMVSIYASVLVSGDTPWASDGSPYITWQECGVALTRAAQPYGRMPGACPLAGAVRFTKGLQIRDAGIANGQKTYNVTFEVTEV